MHGAVLLDENDEVIRPALIWCDQRTEAQSRELERTIGLDHLIQLTCNPPLTNFTLTKLLWVRENEPKNWQRVRKIMLPKDYVRFRLTGEFASTLQTPREHCCSTSRIAHGQAKCSANQAST
jgi:xylulokinase